MHQIKTSIRRILPGDLPSTDPQELLNRGIFPLGNDLYSCIHQEVRDPDSLEWVPIEGQALPGEVLSEGTVHERHAKLPADLRAQVLRASVRRIVDDVPLELPQGSQAVADLIVDVLAVPQSEVLDTDIVDEIGLIPHSWAGEPKR